MFAPALAAALAWLPAQVLAPSTSRPLAERLGLEGSLDNDTDQGLATEALAALQAGDKAIAGASDEAARTAAFEQWRRALGQSAPLDAVARDERVSISVSRAVLDRLRPDLRRAWRDRFEGLAQAALDAAGMNERALARVAYENPFTRAGAVAEMRLFDAAFERGATATARAALRRLEEQLDPAAKDIVSALARRRALAEPAARASVAAAPTVAGTSLVLERALDLGAVARSDTDRMLEPGFAVCADGRICVQTGENLVLFSPDAAPSSPHERHEPARLVEAARLGAGWLPGFGDRDRAWPQRPACAGTRVALVMGRARETRGNALAVFDLSTSPPTLAWIRHDGEREEEAPLRGRLEYQPGPLACAGLVIAQVDQWEEAQVAWDQQRVDGRNTHAWLVAFDLNDGQVVWKRRLGSGADRRGRALDRFDQPRSTSVASLALGRLGEDEVGACTELGVLARVSLLDGSLIESHRLKRVRHDPDIRPGSGGPFVAADGSLCVAPADADEYVYFQRGGPLGVLEIPHLDRLLGVRDQDIFALVGAEGRRVIARCDGRTGSRSFSLPLPREAEWKGAQVHGARILVAAGGSLFLLDTDLRLRAQLALPGLENEPHAGVWAHDSQVYVAGLGRIWVVRVE